MIHLVQDTGPNKYGFACGAPRQGKGGTLDIEKTTCQDCLDSLKPFPKVIQMVSHASGLISVLYDSGKMYFEITGGWVEYKLPHEMGFKVR